MFYKKVFVSLPAYITKTFMVFLRTTIKVVSIWILGIIFISCDDNNVTDDNLSYSDILNCLIMEYTDLQTISKSTKIAPQNLIRMKYGIIEKNRELTIYLADLKKAYEEDDESEIEDLLDEQEFNISTEIIGKPMPKEEYKDQEYLTNELFQERINYIGESFFNKRIHNLFEDKFTSWGSLKATKDFYLNSEYLKQFHEELKTQLSLVDLNKHLKQRIKAYVELLSLEHSTLYGLKSKDTNIEIKFHQDGVEYTFDDETKDNIVDIYSLVAVEVLDFDIFSIIDQKVGRILGWQSDSEELIQETENAISEQVKIMVNSFDIWILSDINQITKKL
jgi:hypothetical protein